MKLVENALEMASVPAASTLATNKDFGVTHFL